MELIYYIRKNNSQVILSKEPTEDKSVFKVKLSRGVPCAVVVSNGYNSVGYAVCAHGDTFSKQKGLMIARAREANGFSMSHVPAFMVEHINIMLEKSRRAFGNK